jgi:hypothetical protein
MKARIILFPFAAVIEFVGLIVSLLLALSRLGKASYFVLKLFENWPDPDWYFAGWVEHVNG